MFIYQTLYVHHSELNAVFDESTSCKNYWLVNCIFKRIFTNLLHELRHQHLFSLKRELVMRKIQFCLINRRQWKNHAKCIIAVFKWYLTQNSSQRTTFFCHSKIIRFFFALIFFLETMLQLCAKFRSVQHCTRNITDCYNCNIIRKSLNKKSKFRTDIVDYRLFKNFY
jgi:hypothetical protein